MINPSVAKTLLTTVGLPVLFGILAKLRGNQDKRVKASPPISGSLTQQYVSPTSTATPTPTPNLSEIPRITADSKMILDQPIATASAKRYLDNIYQKYIPRTPDVPDPKKWRSPISDYTQDMAESTYTSKLHPALSALMSIAETQAMRPAASGTAKKNPYNIMNPGTQTLYDYTNNSGIGRAVRRFPENITKNWQNSNIVKWRQDPTLRNFIYAFNPSDNPQGELETIIKLINDLGL